MPNAYCGDPTPRPSAPHPARRSSMREVHYHGDDSRTHRTHRSSSRPRPTPSPHRVSVQPPPALSPHRHSHPTPNPPRHSSRPTPEPTCHHCAAARCRRADAYDTIKQFAQRIDELEREVASYRRRCRGLEMELGASQTAGWRAVVSVPGPRGRDSLDVHYHVEDRNTHRHSSHPPPAPGPHRTSAHDTHDTHDTIQQLAARIDELEREIAAYRRRCCGLEMELVAGAGAGGRW
ncbi:hypothetical protein EDC01DRAFT_760334 [Geopyxis carbonaria]|nr:hypothetical protein EDC01DRAFT_760334 [Geopyxis carbonaria]